MTVDSKNSFENFEKANAPKTVTGIDYLRTIYKAQSLPQDFVAHFSRLFWPSFVCNDEVIFVADLFDKDRYDGFRLSGHSRSSAQFWTGLLEITGLFDELSIHEASEFAERLVAAWNQKLSTEYGQSMGQFRVIKDEAAGEVFAAIGMPD
jgi:hypothetical protein